MYPLLMVFLIFIQNFDILMTRFLRVILHAQKIVKFFFLEKYKEILEIAKVWHLQELSLKHFCSLMKSLLHVCWCISSIPTQRQGNMVSSRSASSPRSYSRSVRHCETLSQTKSRKGNTTLFFCLGFYSVAIP